MKISFKLKLIFSYIFVILVSFGFIAFFLDNSLEENSLRNIQSSLITQTYLIESQISPDRLRQAETPYLESLIKGLSLKTKCRITVIDNKGKVLADSEKSEEEIPQMENHLYRPEVRVALSGGIGIDKHYSHTLKIDMLYVALPIKDNSAISGVVRLALPLETVQKTLSAIRRTILIGLLFALVFAFILGSFVASSTIRPINRMIEVSRRFSKGDFSRRILQAPKNEIGELAAALNKMAQDVEDRIRQIGAQNQKLAAIFHSMIEGIIVVDKESRIISVNPAIEKIFNVSGKKIEGKTFLETVRNNDINKIITSVLRDGEALSEEIALVLPVRKAFEINAAPVFDGNIVSGCLVVIHDITEIRRLENIRKDFVANVSHELKTPLTSIKGFVETLLEGALEDKENNRNFLKIIHEHTERLNSLVDDLLSLSYLESKEIALKKSTFNLKQQAESIVSGFSSQLKKRNIEVRNELTAEISLTADKEKLGQVLTNLIDNAIKFNKENGLVRIYGEEKSGTVKISVEDSGIGIPEKDLPRIFERFYRVNKARSRELAGTGLGLSIVKHIIELHKGSAGVESTEGLGSTFWFILPK